MLELVKDLDEYQITFYWIGSENKKVSPNLPTLTHAQEWFFEHMYAQFDGKERRKRKFDRRQSNTMRTTLHSKRNIKSTGRRSTDKTITVDIDLSQEKISALKSAV